jgi:hypothetical protein
MYLYLRKRQAPHAHDVKRSLRALRRAWFTKNEPKATREFTDDELAIATRSTALLVVGTIYLMVFIPLTYFYCTYHGSGVLRILLFFEFPKALPDNFFDSLFPRLLMDEARPLLTALLSCYGMIAIIGSLLILTSDRIKLAVYANGLLQGFILTWIISGSILHTTISFKFNGIYVFSKFIYVMLAYYICVIVTDNFSGAHVSREKYNMLVGGIYGILSGWLLTHYFGGSAVIFTGGLYLLTTFLCMSFMEKILTTYKDGMVILSGATTEEWSVIDRGYSLREMGRLLKSAGLRHRSLFLALTALFSIWPIFLLVLYHYVLEGRA